MKLFIKHIVIVFLSMLSLNVVGQINEAVRFRITDPNQNTDETLIRLSDETTTEFDSFWDAWKLFAFNDNVPSLYTNTSNDEPLAINAIPKMTKDTVLNVDMRARYVGGEYTMHVEFLGTQPDNIKMAIKDLENEAIYELSNQLEFNFNVNADLNSDFTRFELFYSAKTQVEVTDNELSATNNGCFNWTYELIDKSNQTSEFGSSSTENLSIQNLDNGEYTLIVTDDFSTVDTINFQIDSEIETTENNETASIVNTNVKPFKILSLENCINVEFDTNLGQEITNMNVYTLSGKAYSDLYYVDEKTLQINVNNESPILIMILEIDHVIYKQKLKLN